MNFSMASLQRLHFVCDEDVTIVGWQVMVMDENNQFRYDSKLITLDKHIHDCLLTQMDLSHFENDLQNMTNPLIKYCELAHEYVHIV